MNFDRLIQKTCVLKINTEKGVQKFTSLRLPESFDKSGDQLQMPAQFSETSTPFLYDFKIIHFAVRALKKNGAIIDCNNDYATKKIYWVDTDGRHLTDYNYIFKFKNIEVGDVIEYSYEIEFRGGYSFDLFYFNSDIPKQNTELSMLCLPHPLGYDFICNTNVADSNFNQKKIIENDKDPIWKFTYRYKNLKSIDYPLNSCYGKSLPHLSIDYRRSSRGRHFEWVFTNTIFQNHKLYNREHASIRKFLSTLPNLDSVNLETFLLSLNKRLNDLKFSSAESMNYSDEAQYAVSSSEWLAKGRLIEEFMADAYEAIFRESNIPYKVICLEDKRLGELKTQFRSEKKYERYFFAIPSGNNLLYMMQRDKGQKYLLGEIPFYYEGVSAAIIYNHDISAPVDSNYKFMRTQSSTENENVRTESALCKVNLDSSQINVLIKENLSGQFSTLIRPLYLGESIDSTVNPVYFKKCIAKPNAFAMQVKLISKSDYFPFKYSFNCTEKITLQSKNEIPLKNWFSFTYNKNVIPKKPNSDYFTDFKYTDSYNYMFEFSKPIEIINLNDFLRSIHNSNFDLSSNMIKQTDTSYLLNINVKVKQILLPENEGQLLVQLATELDALNELVIKLLPGSF